MTIGSMKKPDVAATDAGRSVVASADSTALAAKGQGALSTATLATLAERINHEHRQCEAAVRSMLQHARKCGEHLLRAKDLVRYGRFEAWIKVNCKVSPRQARSYMILARNWGKLMELSDRKRASELSLESLSIRAALRIMASDNQDWIYGTQFCPACGERMIISSRWYETCPACWDCKLYRRRYMATSHDPYRPVANGNQIKKDFGRLVDPTHQADVLVSLLAALDESAVVELTRMLGSNRSERRRVAASVIEQLGGTVPATFNGDGEQVAELEEAIT